MGSSWTYKNNMKGSIPKSLVSLDIANNQLDFTATNVLSSKKKGYLVSLDTLVLDAYVNFFFFYY